MTTSNGTKHQRTGGSADCILIERVDHGVNLRRNILQGRDAERCSTQRAHTEDLYVSGVEGLSLEPSTTRFEQAAS